MGGVYVPDVRSLSCMAKCASRVMLVSVPGCKDSLFGTFHHGCKVCEVFSSLCPVPGMWYVCCLWSMGVSFHSVKSLS